MVEKRTGEILTQAEIDALIESVDEQGAETSEDVGNPGMPRRYSFTQQDRIVRGRLPTLEMINDRFSRYFRAGLFEFLRKTCEVSVLGVTMVKFSEYLHSLVVPSDLNLTRIQPLRGTALTVFDPSLVFNVIDSFFGGNGRLHTRIEGREFTPTENRVIQIMLDKVYAAMTEAWAPVMKLRFKFINSEINLQFANIVSPTETVVVCRFHVDMDGGGGEVHLTLPYSMIEPIRELLNTGMQSDRADHDERWMRSMREEVFDAEVAVSAKLAEASLSIRDFLALRPGDVLTIGHPDHVTVYAEDVPIFHGHFGTHGGNLAVGFDAVVTRPEIAFGALGVDPSFASDDLEESPQ